MLDKEIISNAKKRKLICLKENFVLVEMSYLSPPQNLYEILYEIRVNDYIPV